MQQSLVDYSFALAVANGLVALIVLMLRRQNNDALVRALSVVLSLVAVLYTAWAAGALDIQHSALVYLAIALGPSVVHVAYKTTPASSSSAATPTPAAQDTPTTSPEAALQAVAAQVVAATGQ